MRQLGLDLGGTKIKLAVLVDGRFVSRDETETRSEDGPDAVLERVIELGRGAGDADSVGVAVPGLVDEGGTALLFPNLHGAWAGRQVLAPLEKGLGRPVRLLNDGHAFALAEASLGAGTGCSTVMCIVCGTGIGGGLALDGVLHLGPDARAGEFGHHTVAEDGSPCACGNRGCLELYAGSRAIAEASGVPSFDEALEPSPSRRRARGRGAAAGGRVDRPGARERRHLPLPGSRGRRRRGRRGRRPPVRSPS